MTARSDRSSGPDAALSGTYVITPAQAITSS
jgi:hypothetical protein